MIDRESIKTFSRIIGDQAELRVRVPEEASAFLDLVNSNRQRVAPWFPWLSRIRSIDDMRDSIEYYQRTFARRAGLCTGVYVGGEPAGIIELSGLDDEARYASLAYLIDERFEVKGHVTESCRAVLEYAFDDLGLNRVEIVCASENTRSRAIPQRLGFTHEATRREYIWLDDHYTDQLIYGLLAREWRADA